MLLKKIIIANIDHVTSNKFTMRDMIEHSIFPRIIDSRFNHFHANDLFSFPAAEDANASSAAIQVIQYLASVELSEFPCDLVQFFRLLCIGLEERLRPDLELKIFEPLNHKPFTRISLR